MHTQSYMPPDLWYLSLRTQLFCITLLSHESFLIQTAHATYAVVPRTLEQSRVLDTEGVLHDLRADGLVGC